MLWQFLYWDSVEVYSLDKVYLAVVKQAVSSKLIYLLLFEVISITCQHFFIRSFLKQEDHLSKAKGMFYHVVVAAITGFSGVVNVIPPKQSLIFEKIKKPGLDYVAYWR